MPSNRTFLATITYTTDSRTEMTPNMNIYIREKKNVHKIKK